MKRIFSIDPGSHTGYVVVDFELAPGLDVNRARLVDSGIIYPSRTNREESEAERDILLIGKIAEKISEFRPSTVVLEEPVDAAMYWGKGREAGGVNKGIGMGRGTLFRLGVYYGLALAAVKIAGHADAISYPVQGTKTRAGWMGRGARRANVLREMTYLYAKLSGTPIATLKKVSDHELMALGVLNYHASQLNLVAPRGTRATA